MAAHLLNGLWRAQQTFDVDSLNGPFRPGYDICWANHSRYCHRSKSALPSSHHVVNKVTRRDLFILRTVVTPRDFAIHILIFNFFVGNAMMDRHTENWQFLCSQVRDFTENIREPRYFPMPRHIPEPFNTGRLH